MVQPPKTPLHNNVLVAASVFGSHMNNLSRGFTSESVKFMLGTFSNWVCPSGHNENLINEESNINEYLEDLALKGYAKKLTRKAPYRYTLSESGLIELTSRVVNHSYLYSRVEFFFVFSYLENYSPRTFSMMKNKGSYFPYQARLEIESLLDLEYFLEKQFEICHREISSLKERIELANEINQLITPIFEKDEVEIINIIEGSHPFALHSMLGISNFLDEFTPKQVVWELKVGIKRRSEQLWKFELEKLELHVRQLKTLKKEHKLRQISLK